MAPIPVADWFEGGEADPAARKDAVMATHPELAWGETDGSRPAQAEAAAMIADWLSPRPLEALPLEGGGLGGGVGTATAGSHGGDSPPSDNPPAHTPNPDPSPLEGEGRQTERPPLLGAARCVPDDLCLMERRDREWTLTAASLCAPSFFSAAEAVGLPLSQLHAPVPGFGETLLARTARIFDRLADDTVLERRNWSVVNSGELFLPSSEPLREVLAGQTVEAVAASLVVRRERQTIRRLPRTGAILFTIRIWREPLPDLLADPGRRAAFAAAWAGLMSDEGEPFRRYKRLDLLDPAVRVLLGAPEG